MSNPATILFLQNIRRIASNDTTLTHIKKIPNANDSLKMLLDAIKINDYLTRVSFKGIRIETDKMKEILRIFREKPPKSRHLAFTVHSKLEAND